MWTGEKYFLLIQRFDLKQGFLEPPHEGSTCNCLAMYFQTHMFCIFFNMYCVNPTALLSHICSTNFALYLGLQKGVLSNDECNNAFCFMVNAYGGSRIY